MEIPLTSSALPALPVPRRSPCLTCVFRSKPATHSDVKAATHSGVKAATRSESKAATCSDVKAATFRPRSEWVAGLPPE